MKRFWWVVGALAAVFIATGCARAPEPLALEKRMYGAAIRGDISAAEELVSRHPDLIRATAGNAYGSTPLHFAAYNRQTNFARWLIDRHADVAAVNKFGVTPLHDAASQGCTDIVKMMLAKYPPIDLKDLKGKTPLRYAMENNHKDVVDVLLKYGAHAEELVER